MVMDWETNGHILLSLRNKWLPLGRWALPGDVVYYLCCFGLKKTLALLALTWLLAGCELALTWLLAMNLAVNLAVNLALAGCKSGWLTEVGS